ncbi:MAG: ribonuclease H [Gemmatimonadales bacterium]|jgi:ribonuclease HI
MNAREFRDLVSIHADESCLGNQFRDQARPGAAAGLIELFDERRGWIRRDYYVCEPDTTNNRMALRSAIEGLGSLKGTCRVAFHSDSSYLIKGMQEWLPAWIARGWKRKGGPIENLELWQKLKKIADRHKIEWLWLRGHAGDAKNEYVHHLAVQAARRQRSSKGLIDSGFGAWLEAQQEKGRFLDFFDLPPERAT